MTARRHACSSGFSPAIAGERAVDRRRHGAPEPRDVRRIRHAHAARDAAMGATNVGRWEMRTVSPRARPSRPRARADTARIADSVEIDEGVGRHRRRRALVARRHWPRGQRAGRPARPAQTARAAPRVVPCTRASASSIQAARCCSSAAKDAKHRPARALRFTCTQRTRSGPPGETPKSGRVEQVTAARRSMTPRDETLAAGHQSLGGTIDNVAAKAHPFVESAHLRQDAPTVVMSHLPTAAGLVLPKRTSASAPRP
jgi:hypothetical protein